MAAPLAAAALAASVSVPSPAQVRRLVLAWAGLASAPVGIRTQDVFATSEWQHIVGRTKHENADHLAPIQTMRQYPTRVNERKPFNQAIHVFVPAGEEAGAEGLAEGGIPAADRHSWGRAEGPWASVAAAVEEEEDRSRLAHHEGARCQRMEAWPAQTGSRQSRAGREQDKRAEGLALRPTLERNMTSHRRHARPCAKTSVSEPKSGCNAILDSTTGAVTAHTHRAS